MAMEFIGSTQGTFMQENGQTGRAMGVEFTLVKMGVDLWGSSSGVSNTGLVTTISGNFSKGEFYSRVSLSYRSSVAIFFFA